MTRLVQIASKKLRRTMWDPVGMRSAVPSFARPQAWKHGIVGPGVARRRRLSNRGGALLVCVVVCLSIATALATAGVRSALDLHRQARVDRRLAQAEWLVEAGAQRAAARLRSDSDYDHETWTLDGDVLPGYGPAVVKITVDRSPSTAAARVVVEVTVSSDSPQPVRRRGEFALAQNVP